MTTTADVDKALDAYFRERVDQLVEEEARRTLNGELFKVEPDVEVSAADEWDYFVTDELPAEGYTNRFYRHALRSFSLVRILDEEPHEIRVEQEHVQYVPHSEPIAQLRALMSEWRARGWGDLADTVEEGDDGPVYDELTHREAHVDTNAFKLSGCKFYKRAPAPPWDSFAQVFNQGFYWDGMGGNARITNLTVDPDMPRDVLYFGGSRTGVVQAIITNLGDAGAPVWTCRNHLTPVEYPETTAACEVCGRGRGD